MPPSLTPVLDSLKDRTRPLSVAEVENLAHELVFAPKTDRMRDTYLRRVERSGLLDADKMTALRARVTSYKDDLYRRGLEAFPGHIGIDHEGDAVEPGELHFEGIDRPSGTIVYVSHTFSKEAKAILEDDDFKKYFAGARSLATKTLALAKVVIDHDAEALSSNGIKSEEERTLFAWELLARVDFALNGATVTEATLGSKRLHDDYQALKGFVELSGLRPMSQRALAIRDGRDFPVAFFEGQGANYVKELKEMVESEPTALALFNELKPLFAKYDIDLDHLLTLADADPAEIENYLSIYGVTVSMPVSSLVQALRIRVMEAYGYDFQGFNALTGQSGGLPAAYFAAGSYEVEGWQQPLVPKGLGGLRSVQSYHRFLEWMLVEGRLQQKGTEQAYAPNVTKFGALKGWLDEKAAARVEAVKAKATADKKEPKEEDVEAAKLPTASDIDSYFAQYRLVNMSISGIPYDVADSEIITRQILGIQTAHGEPVEPQPASPLGKLLYAINEKFRKSGHGDGEPGRTIEPSYVFMSNLNTGATTSGKRSWFILTAGRGPALAELAKLIVLKKAEGYSPEVQAIVDGWKDNKNVGIPITNTRVTLAPHDPKVLQAAYDAHLKWAMDHGMKLSAPSEVIQNWKFEILKDFVATTPETDDWFWTKILLAQQYLFSVDVPGMTKQALNVGATSLIGVGPGGRSPYTHLPANAEDSPVQMAGVEGQDHEQVKGWTRVTTTDPKLAYAATPRNAVDAEEKAVETLKKLKGVTVEDAGEKVSVRIDEPLSEADFKIFVETLAKFPRMTTLVKLMTAEKLSVNGVEQPNALRGLLANRAGLEYVIGQSLEVGDLMIRERGVVRITFDSWPTGEAIRMGEYSHHPNGSQTILARHFRITRDGDEVSFSQLLKHAESGYDFRAETRKAYARDWDIPESAFALEIGASYTDSQTVTRQRMIDFANSVETRDEKFLTGAEAHPSLLIDLLWKGMLAPTFSDKLDLDFTRVIDEGKQIEMGVPIREGDTITTEARIIKAEDFKKGSYEGRRVTVYAVAKNQKGEVVGRVISTMVSRIPNRVQDGKTKTVYAPPSPQPSPQGGEGKSDTIDLLSGKKAFELADKHVVAKGSLQISRTLADSYGQIDPNRIHRSDLSAALAGIPSGRIMQGLGTLAYVNEQIVRQLQRDGIGRAYKGIQSLAFSGFVSPGDELTYELTRLKHAEGDHLYKVEVKRGDKVVLTYELVMEGPKTAVIFTGQGSQYVGMGKDIIADDDRKEMLDELQEQVSLDEQGRPKIDLLKAMNSGSTDTSKAQPMIMAYSFILFERMKAQGLIPADAVYSGHSLGMWIALLASGAVKDVGNAMEAVRLRGEAMQRYNLISNPQGMVAVLAPDGVPPLDEAKVRLLQDAVNADDKSLDMANDNSPQQVVLGGHKRALAEATPILEAWGYKVVPLGVSNAFHTRLMKPASGDFAVWIRDNGNPFANPQTLDIYLDILGKKLSEVLDKTIASFRARGVAIDEGVLSKINYEFLKEATETQGDPASPAGEIGDELKGQIAATILAVVMTQQIQSNVQWRATVREMLKDGVRRFIEIGPASTRDKTTGTMVGAKNGILAGLVAKEAEALGISGQIEIVFANPMLNKDAWPSITFEVKPKVSEYARPHIVRPKPKVAEQAATTTPSGPAAPAPAAVAAAAVAAVSPEQVKAVVTGFFKDNPADDKADVNALAEKLSGQLATLGAGARAPLSARLTELVGPSAGASSGPGVEEQVFKVLQKFKPEIKSMPAPTDGLTDKLGIDSGLAGNVMGALKGALNIDVSDSDITPGMTFGDLVKLCVAKGAKGGAAAASSTLSKQDQVEKTAIDKALAKLPAALAVGAAVAVAPVAVEKVNEVRTQFLTEKKNDVDAANTDDARAPLVAALAEKYQALGAGAVPHLEARLGQLSPSAGGAAPASGPGVEEQVFKVLQKFKPEIKSMPAPTDGLTDKLGIDSGLAGNVMGALKGALNIDVSDSDITPGMTFGDLVKLCVAKGAKGGAGAATAAAAPVLSNADLIDRLAIEKVLPGLRAQMAGPMVAGMDPAQMQELRAMIDALKARVAELEAWRGRPVGSATAGTPVELQPDGEFKDPRDVELERLQRIIDNMEKGTSRFFVHQMMQPHFDPNKIYKFSHAEQNGGRINLMQFVADLRNGKLSTDFWDRNARINRLANQLDGIGLQWLDGFIAREYEALRKAQPSGNRSEIGLLTQRIGVLNTLRGRAQLALETGGIVTGQVATIRAGDHVPEYGSPHKTNFVPREGGTGVFARELGQGEMADPKIGADLLQLLNNGYDLRGVRVLVHEAGTMSYALIAKLLQLGADVLVTNYSARNKQREDGQYQNDLFWHLYNDNAARGARLTVLPNMQPGNPHDEDNLLKVFTDAIDNIMKFEVLVTEGDKAEERNRAKQAEVIDFLPFDKFGLELRARMAAAHGAKKALILTAEEKQEAIRRILPQMYINGAAKEDYGPITGRGDPHTVMGVMVFAARYIALNLAALHQKHETGKRLAFLNFTSPNDGSDLGTDGTIVASALPFSRNYPLAKAALAGGHLAAEAKANGIVDADGNAILVEVTAKTGWGKSDGERKTIMSGNDFFTMAVEEAAKEEGIDLLTLTGDQLATVQLAALLALHSRTRPGEHLDYDFTYGFLKAAAKGLLQKLFVDTRKAEELKHKDAKEAWEKKEQERLAKIDPAYIPNDGSLIDLNNLNIAIVDAPAGHRYAAKPDDILFDDDTPAVVGYGMVGPLGPDALTNYRNMLAAGHFKGHAGFEWLGEYDFYNLARSIKIEEIAKAVGIEAVAKWMGVDISGWDEAQKKGYLNGIAEWPEPNKGVLFQHVVDNALQGDEGLSNALQNWLIKNSGIQIVEGFVEFEVYRDVTYKEDTEIPVTDPETAKKMALTGMEFRKRADGSVYAIARAGTTYKQPYKYKLPTTVAGDLPGGKKFSWNTFGNFDFRDMESAAHATKMTKMVMGQIMMSMGGYSPQEIVNELGSENILVAIGTGLGDLEPYTQGMTVKPLIESDKVVNYLMASLLPDASAGQVATEQMGATGMALCVVAACSTGNANIVMAVREMFARYYMATKFAEAHGEKRVNWDEVFARLWMAGGVDYCITFNAVFGFHGVGATLRDDWFRARDIILKHITRPDDEEAANFLLASGGGAQGLMPTAGARKTGRPVYSGIFGASFRTDGYQKGKAREGYGIGQRLALFEAWEQAKEKLTNERKPLKDVETDIANRIEKFLGTRPFNDKTKMGDLGLRRTELTNFLKAINKDYGLDVQWNQVKDHSVEEFAWNTWWHSRTLKKKVVFIVVAHKTSTKEGDPFEEESLRSFLKTVLPPGAFAHLAATKGHLGHMLGGSSGGDAGLTPLLLRLLGIPGVPGLDNVRSHVATNAYLLHHKEALNLRDLYDPDTTFVVIREAAGFNAKNTAIIEVAGKLKLNNEADAQKYVKLLVEHYARERVQKRGERTGVRKMMFDFANPQIVDTSEFAELYELYLRSDAVARALLSGKTFDFEKIPSWIYHFPVNKEHKALLGRSAVQLGDQEERISAASAKMNALADGSPEKVAAKAEIDKMVAENFGRSNLSRHNAIKYAEAYDQIRDIISSFSPTMLREIGEEAKRRGWDKQPVVFYGVSDGMGLRTLLALMVSGAVKEIVGIHLDAPVNDPQKRAGKISSYTPEILKTIAAERGINLKVFNQSGILYALRDDPAKNIKAGDKLPLQDNIKEAIEAARKRCTEAGGNGDLLFWNYVAFGAPWRRPGAERMLVPTLDDYGRLSYTEVSTAQDEETALQMTINPMGNAHGLLLRYFIELGWLGPNSATFTADWWGSESQDMLYGVYGGAVLGDAKLVQKKDLIEIQKLVRDLTTKLVATLAYEVMEGREVADPRQLRLDIGHKLLNGQKVDALEIAGNGPLAELLTSEGERAAFIRVLSKAYFGRQLSWDEISGLTVDQLIEKFAGKHAYIGYPAFLSFALHQIPGGTLTGVIAKRIYEDIQAGKDVEGFDRTAIPAKELENVRFYSMEELAIRAVRKSVFGEYTEGYGGTQNKIAVDTYEKLIAKAIDIRFKEIAKRTEAAVRAKALQAVKKEVMEDKKIPEAKKAKAIAAALEKALPKTKLTPEESYAILKDLVTDDYLKYCIQHVQKPKERLLAMRGYEQEKNGIERLPLPKNLQTKYPFFQRAIAPGANTPELAIAVIDAGGVGTLFAGYLSPKQLDAEITKVKDAVGKDAPLVVNIMWSAPGRDKQIEAVMKNRPTAVSFGNGIVTKEVVDTLHLFGIAVIQLAGTDKVAAGAIASGVDFVIAERNYGPGHIAEGEGSDPKTLTKRMRQALYDAGIPVIAGGGFVEADDVKDAFHWGASAIQLDDVIAYSAESAYPGKTVLKSVVSAMGDEGTGPTVPAVDPAHPVLTIKDADDKPIRLLNTLGAEKLAQRLQALRDQKHDAKILRPLVDRLLALGLDAAAKGNLEDGIFLASERIGQVQVGEPVEAIFRRLMGEKPEVPKPSGLGPSGHGEPVEPSAGPPPPPPPAPMSAANRAEVLGAVANYMNHFTFHPATTIQGGDLVKDRTFYTGSADRWGGRVKVLVVDENTFALGRLLRKELGLPLPPEAILITGQGAVMAFYRMGHKTETHAHPTWTVHWMDQGDGSDGDKIHKIVRNTFALQRLTGDESNPLPIFHRGADGPPGEIPSLVVEDRGALKAIFLKNESVATISEDWRLEWECHWEKVPSPIHSYQQAAKVAEAFGLGRLDAARVVKHLRDHGLTVKEARGDQLAVVNEQKVEGTVVNQKDNLAVAFRVERVRDGERKLVDEVVDLGSWKPVVPEVLARMRAEAEDRARALPPLNEEKLVRDLQVEVVLGLVHGFSHVSVGGGKWQGKSTSRERWRSDWISGGVGDDRRIVATSEEGGAEIEVTADWSNDWLAKFPVGIAGADDLGKIYLALAYARSESIHHLDQHQLQVILEGIAYGRKLDGKELNLAQGFLESILRSPLSANEQRARILHDALEVLPKFAEASAPVLPMSPAVPGDPAEPAAEAAPAGEAIAAPAPIPLPAAAGGRAEGEDALTDGPRVTRDPDETTGSAGGTGALMLSSARIADGSPIQVGDSLDHSGRFVVDGAVVRVVQDEPSLRAERSNPLSAPETSRGIATPFAAQRARDDAHPAPHLVVAKVALQATAQAHAAGLAKTAAMLARVARELEAGRKEWLELFGPQQKLVAALRKKPETAWIAQALEASGVQLLPAQRALLRVAVATKQNAEIQAAVQRLIPQSAATGVVGTASPIVGPASIFRPPASVIQMLK